MGGLATTALVVPKAVAFDTSGNMYISDNSSVIRKVSAATGDISNFAGTGIPGYGGDGGPATSAQIDLPAGIVVDGSGNVYFSDYQNSIVRKIDSTTGEISLFAGTARTTGYFGDGGAATSAQLYLPRGLAIDSSGNIFISDYINNRIREVNAGTGIISTVVGNGTPTYGGDGGAATSASLFWPAGVAVDTSGNIYIADSQNSRVRMVTAATGHISTLAGDGIQGYGGDGGAGTSAKLASADDVSVDASGNVFIADFSNNRIREVSKSTGHISTVAGNGTSGYTGDNGQATSAEITVPTGILVDASGNLFISDGNFAVRKVVMGTGIISTIAGNSTNGYGGDGGLATSSELYFPQGIAFDSTGNLYIADATNSRIRKVTASTGDISTVAGNGSAGFVGDGGAATSATLSTPLDVTIDSSGNIYIADYLNYRIRKVTIGTGNISTVAGNGTEGYSGDGGAATSAELDHSNAVAVDSSGNIFIADASNCRIREVLKSNGHISTVAGNGTCNYSGDGAGCHERRARFSLGSFC